MEKRLLGRKGERVSVIGFGAWPIGGGMGTVDERQAIATIHAAIDRGITLIDTAQAYRSSEGVIGKALTGGLRERVFLATKASFDFSPKGIRAAIEESLRNLRTDHVDLYQLHSWSAANPVEESLVEMERLREEGKLRFIGISNYSVEQTQRAMNHVRIDSIQPVYNMFDRGIEEGLLAYCEQEGIGILAHSIFAKGLLTGKYRPDHRFPSGDERSSMPRFQGEEFARYLARADRIKAIASELGASLVQLAIAWVLRNPAVTCALAGAKSPEQVAEQVRGAELELDENTAERIEEALA